MVHVVLLVRRLGPEGGLADVAVYHKAPVVHLFGEIFVADLGLSIGCNWQMLIINLCQVCSIKDEALYHERSSPLTTHPLVMLQVAPQLEPHAAHVADELPGRVRRVDGDHVLLEVLGVHEGGLAQRALPRRPGALRPLSPLPCASLVVFQVNLDFVLARPRARREPLAAVRAQHLPPTPLLVDLVCCSVVS